VPANACSQRCKTQFGSYALVVEPVGSALLALAAREHTQRLIAYDPNVRLNVEPDLSRWRAVVEQMVALSHFVKVSDEDLALLYSRETPEQVAARWIAVGVSLVTVTRGGRGASSWTRNAKVDVPSLSVKVVDTVGAGDTFQAALLSWLDEQDKLSASAMASLDTKALEAMLKFASKASSITCSRRGADMPRRNELD